VRRPLFLCVRMDFPVAYGSNELIPNSGNYSVQRLDWLCKLAGLVYLSCLVAFPLVADWIPRVREEPVDLSSYLNPFPLD
jgi:hypothetical protein